MSFRPLVFLTFIDYKISFTRSFIITGRHKEYLIEEEGWMPEAFRLELNGKMEAENIFFYEGVLALDPSERIT